MVIHALDHLADLETTRLIYAAHCVEEIPSFITHALFLEDGRVAACGPMAK